MGIQSIPWLRGHGLRRMHGRLSSIRVAALGTFACKREAVDKSAEQPRPQQTGQPVNPVKLAAHLRAARVPAVSGKSRAGEEHITVVATEPRRFARAAVRAIDGARTSLWLDRENLVVMVGGKRHRSMETIDRVYVAIEPLGDTLVVIVNEQDITAKNGDEAETLSRHCQLPEGERAFLQKRREVDVVAPEVGAQLKRMQGKPP